MLRTPMTASVVGPPDDAAVSHRPAGMGVKKEDVGKLRIVEHLGERLRSLLASSWRTDMPERKYC